MAMKTLLRFLQSSVPGSRKIKRGVVMLFVAVGMPLLAQDLAPARLREDLHVLRDSLEEGHSGLYRYTPKAEIDHVFEQTESRLDRPMNWRQFYALVLPIIARIRCGHTHITPGAQLAEEVETGIPLLPLDVQIVGGRPWILRDYTAGDQKLQVAELIAINGKKAVDLLAPR